MPQAARKAWTDAYDNGQMNGAAAPGQTDSGAAEGKH